jgi:hypothetical protein
MARMAWQKKYYPQLRTGIREYKRRHLILNSSFKVIHAFVPLFFLLL